VSEGEGKGERRVGHIEDEERQQKIETNKTQD
jgi:hypothetical protein